VHVRTESRVYRFGPFELDPDRRRLTRGRDQVFLPDRQLDVLLLLVARAGHIVSKETLSDDAWHGQAVTDNSIVQAIRALRETLGAQPDGAPYIETLVRKGYRFVAQVDCGPPPLAAADTRALLEPYEAFVDGRAALETLNREKLLRAGQAFAEALRLQPDFPAAHIGAANVYLLRYESTRADLAPDRAALEQAEHHARAACRLAPSSGDAWGTFALVRHRSGATREAIAAARKAVALEPMEWRHYLRLASVSWGAERLLAAHHLLSLCPGLAIGHWFIATVFIARGAIDAAIEHLRRGCDAQDAQSAGVSPLTTVGLHWLLGLVLAARGDDEGAREEFLRELAIADPGHVYGRECGANTWYGIGALSLRQGRQDEACSAFQEALRINPGHALATLGLAAARREPDITALRPSSALSAIDGAMARAAVLALQGKHHEAAGLCRDALLQTEPGSAGWLLPVEPLLHVTARHEAWARTLATLRDRAV
jgi:DNA-binding winged helix-turn-helix (wHTH) protein/Tfp pilus assembly protein PilF